MSSWFNAKHAIPTAELFFIVYVDETFEIAVWLPWKNKWFLNGYEYEHGKDVTHFMPLPDPPVKQTNG